MLKTNSSNNKEMLRNSSFLTVLLSLLILPMTVIAQQTTSLTISPSSFTIESGKFQEVTATLLDENNNPISGKVIKWQPSWNFYPDSVVTDASWEASTYYFAEWGITSMMATITASFGGDVGYLNSSDTTTVAGTGSLASLVFTTTATGVSLVQYTTNCELLDPTDNPIIINGFGSGVINAE